MDLRLEEVAMTIRPLRARGLALAAVLGLYAATAFAAPPPAAPATAPVSPLAARGPFAFSLAAEPLGLHWGLESGFPFGMGRGPGAQRLTGPWRLDVLANAS